MKKAYTVLHFLGVWLVGAGLFFSCETANNVEDPDLHYFVKLYGGDGDQRGVDMLALNDGSLLLLGNSSLSDLQSNVYMVRVSADGDVLWEKIFEDAGYAVAKDMERTIDGNFIVLADYIAQDADSFDIQLLKVSPNGDLLASNTAGTGFHDFSHSVTALAGGDFIVSGTTELTATSVNPNDPDPDLGNMFNYRFGPDLANFLPDKWGPSIAGWGSNLDVAVKIAEVSGGYYVFGYTNSPFSDQNQQERFGLFYLLRDSTGTTGNIKFVDNVNETRIEYVESLPTTFGGGFMIIGSSLDNFGTSKVFMARLRGSLVNTPNDIAMKTTIAFGGRNISGLRATPSFSTGSGFLILGNEVRSTARNFWLSKVDQNGSDLWSASFGSEGEDDSAAAVVELPDGKIVILGTMGMADNQFKMALIKLNAQGQLLKK